MKPSVHSESLCAQVALGHRADGDPLVPALVQSTTFCRDGIRSQAPHQYSRVSNPTVAALESALGELERAPAAVCFVSGMAAETALFLALLRSGDHVVCGRSVYGGTSRLLRRVLAPLGVDFDFVDATRAQEIRGALRAETRLIFVETPANPTLELTDLRAAAALAHDADVRLAVDNTFLTPVLQQPLELGADVSVYSTTKFIEGHSVAPGGAIVSRDAELLDRLRFLRKCTGAIQTPWHAWLTLQGLKTLPLRIRAQSESAVRIASWLAQREEVRRVHYPGREDPDLARAQHLGAHGAVVSFEIEAADRFAESLRLCRLVEHVGSVETLLTHPATMTHADATPSERAAAGIADGLLRLSVGLEAVEDIQDDLAQAFARSRREPSR